MSTRKSKAKQQTTTSSSLPAPSLILSFPVDHLLSIDFCWDSTRSSPLFVPPRTPHQPLPNDKQTSTADTVMETLDCESDSSNVYSDPKDSDMSSTSLSSSSGLLLSTVISEATSSHLSAGLDDSLSLSSSRSIPLLLREVAALGLTSDNSFESLFNKRVTLLYWLFAAIDDEWRKSQMAVSRKRIVPSAPSSKVALLGEVGISTAAHFMLMTMRMAAMSNGIFAIEMIKFALSKLEDVEAMGFNLSGEKEGEGGGVAIGEDILEEVQQTLKCMAEGPSQPIGANAVVTTNDVSREIPIRSLEAFLSLAVCRGSLHSLLTAIRLMLVSPPSSSFSVYSSLRKLSNLIGSVDLELPRRERLSSSFAVSELSTLAVDDPNKQVENVQADVVQQPFGGFGFTAAPTSNLFGSHGSGAGVGTYTSTWGSTGGAATPTLLGVPDSVPPRSSVSDGHVFSACDGSYLYVYAALTSSLHKIGTGLKGTTTGQVVATLRGYKNGSIRGMTCVGDRLYFTLDDLPPSTLLVVSTAHLMEIGTVSIIGNGTIKSEDNSMKILDEYKQFLLMAPSTSNALRDASASVTIPSLERGNSNPGFVRSLSANSTPSPTTLSDIPSTSFSVDGLFSDGQFLYCISPLQLPEEKDEKGKKKGAKDAAVSGENGGDGDLDVKDNLLDISTSQYGSDEEEYEEAEDEYDEEDEYYSDENGSEYDEYEEEEEYERQQQRISRRVMTSKSLSNSAEANGKGVVSIRMFDPDERLSMVHSVILSRSVDLYSSSYLHFSQQGGGGDDGSNDDEDDATSRVVGGAYPNSSVVLVGSPHLVFDGSFTVECWLRVDKKSYGGSESIWFKGDSSRWVTLTFHGNLLQVCAQNEYGQTSCSYRTQKKALRSQWIHAAVIVDIESKKLDLYINGVMASSQQLRGPQVFGSRAVDPSMGGSAQNESFKTTGPWALGGGTANYSPFNGDIAEFRIWKYIRSSGQINDNYKKRLGEEEGLLANFPLDEGMGLTVLDRSKYKVVGTIRNAQWRVNEGDRPFDVSPSENGPKGPQKADEEGGELSIESEEKGNSSSISIPCEFPLSHLSSLPLFTNGERLAVFYPPSVVPIAFPSYDALTSSIVGHIQGLSIVQIFALDSGRLIAEEEFDYMLGSTKSAVSETPEDGPKKKAGKKRKNKYDATTAKKSDAFEFDFVSFCMSNDGLNLFGICTSTTEQVRQYRMRPASTMSPWRANKKGIEYVATKAGGLPTTTELKQMYRVENNAEAEKNATKPMDGSVGVPTQSVIMNILLVLQDQLDLLCQPSSDRVPNSLSIPISVELSVRMFESLLQLIEYLHDEYYLTDEEFNRRHSHPSQSYVPLTALLVALRILRANISHAIAWSVDPSEIGFDGLNSIQSRYSTVLNSFISKSPTNSWAKQIEKRVHEDVAESLGEGLPFFFPTPKSRAQVVAALVKVISSSKTTPKTASPSTSTLSLQCLLVCRYFSKLSLPSNCVGISLSFLDDFTLLRETSQLVFAHTKMRLKSKLKELQSGRSALIGDSKEEEDTFEFPSFDVALPLEFLKKVQLCLFALSAQPRHSIKNAHSTIFDESVSNGFTSPPLPSVAGLIAVRIAMIVIDLTADLIEFVLIQLKAISQFDGHIDVIAAKGLLATELSSNSFCSLLSSCLPLMWSIYIPSSIASHIVSRLFRLFRLVESFCVGIPEVNIHEKKFVSAITTRVAVSRVTVVETPHPVTPGITERFVSVPGAKELTLRIDPETEGALALPGVQLQLCRLPGQREPLQKSFRQSTSVTIPGDSVFVSFNPGYQQSCYGFKLVVTAWVAETKVEFLPWILDMHKSIAMTMTTLAAPIVRGHLLSLYGIIGKNGMPPIGGSSGEGLSLPTSSASKGSSISPSSVPVSVSVTRWLSQEVLSDGLEVSSEWENSVLSSLPWIGVLDGLVANGQSASALPLSKALQRAHSLPAFDRSEFLTVVSKFSSFALKCGIRPPPFPLAADVRPVVESCVQLVLSVLIHHNLLMDECRSFVNQCESSNSFNFKPSDSLVRAFKTAHKLKSWIAQRVQESRKTIPDEKDKEKEKEGDGDSKDSSSDSEVRVRLYNSICHSVTSRCEFLLSVKFVSKQSVHTDGDESVPQDDLKKAFGRMSSKPKTAGSTAPSASSAVLAAWQSQTKSVPLRYADADQRFALVWKSLMTFVSAKEEEIDIDKLKIAMVLRRLRVKVRVKGLQVMREILQSTSLSCVKREVVGPLVNALHQLDRETFNGVGIDLLDGLKTAGKTLANEIRVSFRELYLVLLDVLSNPDAAGPSLLTSVLHAFGIKFDEDAFQLIVGLGLFNAINKLILSAESQREEKEGKRGAEKKMGKEVKTSSEDEDDIEIVEDDSKLAHDLSESASPSSSAVGASPSAAIASQRAAFALLDLITTAILVNFDAHTTHDAHSSTSVDSSVSKRLSPIYSILSKQLSNIASTFRDEVNSEERKDVLSQYKLGGAKAFGPNSKFFAGLRGGARLRAHQISMVPPQTTTVKLGATDPLPSSSEGKSSEGDERLLVSSSSFHTKILSLVDKILRQQYGRQMMWEEAETSVSSSSPLSCVLACLIHILAFGSPRCRFVCLRILRRILSPSKAPKFGVLNNVLSAVEKAEKERYVAKNGNISKWKDLLLSSVPSPSFFPSTSISSFVLFGMSFCGKFGCVPAFASLSSSSSFDPSAADSISPLLGSLQLSSFHSADGVASDREMVMLLRELSFANDCQSNVVNIIHSAITHFPKIISTIAEMSQKGSSWVSTITPSLLQDVFCVIGALRTVGLVDTLRSGSRVKILLDASVGIVASRVDDSSEARVLVDGEMKTLKLSDIMTIGDAHFNFDGFTNKQISEIVNVLIKAVPIVTSMANSNISAVSQSQLDTNKLIESIIHTEIVKALHAIVNTNRGREIVVGEASKEALGEAAPFIISLLSASLHTVESPGQLLEFRQLRLENTLSRHAKPHHHVMAVVTCTTKGKAASAPKAQKPVKGEVKEEKDEKDEKGDSKKEVSDRLLRQMKLLGTDASFTLSPSEFGDLDISKEVRSPIVYIPLDGTISKVQCEGRIVIVDSFDSYSPLSTRVEAISRCGAKCILVAKHSDEGSESTSKGAKEKEKSRGVDEAASQSSLSAGLARIAGGHSFPQTQGFSLMQPIPQHAQFGQSVGFGVSSNTAVVSAPFPSFGLQSNDLDVLQSLMTSSSRTSHSSPSLNVSHHHHAAASSTSSTNRRADPPSKSTVKCSIPVLFVSSFDIMSLMSHFPLQPSQLAVTLHRNKLLKILMERGYSQAIAKKALSKGEFDLSSAEKWLDNNKNWLHTKEAMKFLAKGEGSDDDDEEDDSGVDSTEESQEDGSESDTNEDEDEESAIQAAPIRRPLEAKVPPKGSSPPAKGAKPKGGEKKEEGTGKGQQKSSSNAKPSGKKSKEGKESNEKKDSQKDLKEIEKEKMKMISGDKSKSNDKKNDKQDDKKDEDKKNEKKDDEKGKGGKGKGKADNKDEKVDSKDGENAATAAKAKKAKQQEDLSLDAAWTTFQTDEVIAAATTGNNPYLNVNRQPFGYSDGYSEYNDPNMGGPPQIAPTSTPSPLNEYERIAALLRQEDEKQFTKDMTSIVKDWVPGTMWDSSMNHLPISVFPSISMLLSNQRFTILHYCRRILISLFVNSKLVWPSPSMSVLSSLVLHRDPLAALPTVSEDDDEKRTTPRDPRIDLLRCLYEDSRRPPAKLHESLQSSILSVFSSKSRESKSDIMASIRAAEMAADAKAKALPGMKKKGRSKQTGVLPIALAAPIPTPLRTDRAKKAFQMDIPVVSAGKGSSLALESFTRISVPLAISLGIEFVESEVFAEKGVAFTLEVVVDFNPMEEKKEMDNKDGKEEEKGRTHGDHQSVSPSSIIRYRLHPHFSVLRVPSSSAFIRISSESSPTATIPTTLKVNVSGSLPSLFGSSVALNAFSALTFLDCLLYTECSPRFIHQALLALLGVLPYLLDKETAQMGCRLSSRLFAVWKTVKASLTSDDVAEVAKFIQSLEKSHSKLRLKSLLNWNSNAPPSSHMQTLLELILAGRKALEDSSGKGGSLLDSDDGYDGALSHPLTDSLELAYKNFREGDKEVLTLNLHERKLEEGPLFISNIPVNQGYHINTHTTYSTFIPAVSIKDGGKFYYEVTVVEWSLRSSMSIGWVDRSIRFASMNVNSVAFDPQGHSWTVHVQQGNSQYYHRITNRPNGDMSCQFPLSSYVGQQAFACGAAFDKIEAGSVIGCAIDMNKREMRFSHNGKFDHQWAFSQFESSVAMFPVFSITPDCQIELNLGRVPFEYPPDDIEIRKYFDSKGKKSKSKGKGDDESKMSSSETKDEDNLYCPLEHPSVRHPSWLSRYVHAFSVCESFRQRSSLPEDLVQSAVQRELEDLKQPSGEIKFEVVDTDGALRKMGNLQFSLFSPTSPITSPSAAFDSLLANNSTPIEFTKNVNLHITFGVANANSNRQVDESLQCILKSILVRFPQFTAPAKNNNRYNGGWSFGAAEPLKKAGPADNRVALEGGFTFLVFVSDEKPDLDSFEWTDNFKQQQWKRFIQRKMQSNSPSESSIDSVQPIPYDSFAPHEPIAFFQSAPNQCAVEISFPPRKCRYVTLKISSLSPIVSLNMVGGLSIEYIELRAFHPNHPLGMLTGEAEKAKLKDIAKELTEAIQTVQGGNITPSLSLSQEEALVAWSQAVASRIGVDVLKLAAHSLGGDVADSKMELSRYAAIEKTDIALLRGRFIAIKYLNRLLTPLLHYVDVSALNQSAQISSDSVLQLLEELNISPSSSLSSSMHESLSVVAVKLKGLYFLSTKRSVFDSMLSSSSSSYTQQPMVSVNRMRASKHREDPLKDPDGYRSVFGQIFSQLRGVKYESFRGGRDHQVWKINFSGEGSIDVGGPFRESFTLCASDLMSNVTPLFMKCPNGKNSVGLNREKYIPNPSAKSLSHIAMFEFVGALMGIALRTRQPLALDLPSIVWKGLLQQPTDRGDLEQIDKLCIQALNELMKIDEEEFNRTWAENEKFTTQLSGGEIAELKKGGSMLPVQYSQRGEYVELTVKARLEESRLQTEAIRRGLDAVVPLSMLRLFSPYDVEVFVCGSPHIDIDSLQRHTVCNHPLTQSSNVVKWLFKCLRSFDDAERQLFIKFVWGRNRLPMMDDEWTMPFTIQRLHSKGGGGGGGGGGALMDDDEGEGGGDDSHDDQSLPVSHTCFFKIDLPAYSSYSILRAKVLYAICNCQAIDVDFNPNNNAMNAWID